MTLLEKLKSIRPEDLDRDAAEFFGPDFSIEPDGKLSVAGESVSADAALEAAYGPPPRKVEIGDLES